MGTIAVTEASVRRIADPLSYERGELYATQGRVRDLTVSGRTIRATVDGTYPYDVTLAVTSQDLDGNCTCPYGQDGVFCKHCVAAALVWLDSQPPVADQPHGTSGTSDETLRAFLQKQQPEWLADQLLDVAQRDPLLRAQLDVAAGGDARHAYDDSELRGILVSAISLDDFVHYRSAHAYVTGVDEAIGEVEALIGDGFPDAAIELAEFALDLLEEAITMVDDSDGGVGAMIRRAEEVHLVACQAGNPDRIALAARLATRALTSDWEVFLTAIPDYADVLRDEGMARYREIVQAAWQALPPPQPGHHDFDRFRPTFLMERLAAFDGGTDALIDVIARDITSAYDVLRIAEALVDDGRDDEALDWAARGIAEYKPDPRLRSLAADCHLRAGRRDDALELIWANFAASPSLDTYQQLHQLAGDALTPWRAKALALLCAQPRSNATSPARYSWVESAGHTTLVEVLLWEGDIDAAWSAAHDGGCRSSLWVRLARERAKTHPADAIPILQNAAESAIERKQRPAYQEAARLLRETQRLAVRCDQTPAFHSYMLDLRAKHKAKRALREELDRAGLPN